MKLLSCIVYIAFLGIGSHFLGEALPRDKFDPEKFPYREFSWEKSGKVYSFLRVKQWKNRVPDASRYFKDMIPKNINSCKDYESIQILILETCVAEFIHYLLCICSYGVYLIWHGSAGFFIWELCIIGNLVFVVIQRYNRPKLIRLAKRLKIKEERHNLCEC